MDLDDYQNVLASLQILKQKVHSALESINQYPGPNSPHNANKSPSSSSNRESDTPVESAMKKEVEAKQSVATATTTHPVDSVTPDPNDRAAIKAQREAKKAAKAAKKQGIKIPSSEKSPTGQPEQPKSKPLGENQAKKEEPSGKSKAELRAERRALQEAQREAKAKGEKKAAPSKAKSDSKEKSPTKDQNDTVDSKPPTKSKPTTTIANKTVSVNNIGIPKASKQSVSSSRIIENVFNSIPTFTNNFIGDEIHPLFRHLGVKFSHNLVRGSNSRCVLLMDTIDKFITQEYRTPQGKELKHDLPLKLKPNIAHLKSSACFAVAMENALESLTGMIAEIVETETDEEIKEDLHEKIQGYIEEKIVKAQESIVLSGKEKVHNGDKIVVFSMTEVLQSVITEASKDTSFELIVICPKNTDEDGMFTNGSTFSRWLESREGKDKVKISFLPFTCLGSIVGRVNKVFLGGHALFTNGGVMAHVGSSTVALVAQQCNIPVVFFCETYKFCDKSPTDSFFLNVFHNKTIQNYDSSVVDYFHPVIEYDVTPADLVTSVITDIDILPSTIVPVVLRVQENRLR